MNSPEPETDIFYIKGEVGEAINSRFGSLRSDINKEINEPFQSRGRSSESPEDDSCAKKENNRLRFRSDTVSPVSSTSTLEFEKSSYLKGHDCSGTSTSTSEIL